MEPDQLSLPVDPPAHVLQLRDALGAEWPNITAARERSSETLKQLNRHLTSRIPAETSVVVFGSLARYELTEGSDLDWTLLVDGAANPDHWSATNRIRSVLKGLGMKQPTAGGSFGKLTFSHDLIHKIGGDDDTNQNTTQRLLLLLESVPIGNGGAYNRVVENILTRYIEEDLRGPTDTAFRVPRFLLNDFGRYWRTMAVDFAHKRRARNGEKWALRTTKLRLSRKLLYSAGLLSCFLCDQEFGCRQPRHQWRDLDLVVGYLGQLVRKTPLDILAHTVLRFFGEHSGTGRDLFDAYDRFLGIMNDRQQRDTLKDLSVNEADSDPVYQEARKLAADFQDALTKLFFDGPVAGFTRNYGVF